MYCLSFYVRILKFSRKDPLGYCLSFYVRMLKFLRKDRVCVGARGVSVCVCVYVRIVCVWVREVCVCECE